VADHTVIAGRVGVNTAADGEAITRQYAMLVITEHWSALTGQLRISFSHVILKYQLGVQEEANDLPR